MELRQLEYFLAVAEERNFTRAAERVHISQSGVSAQIRQLERELGAELFDRSARTVTLTVAGKAALEHARQAVAAARAVGQAVGEVSDLIRGSLTVGMVAGCTLTPLFDGLAAFHRAHPGVELALLEDDSAHLSEAVRTGALDLALIGCAGTTPDGLDAHTLIDEPVVAAVPPGHPLAGQPDVTLADLLAHPLICLPPGTGVRTVLDRDCAAAGLTPRIALQASAASAIADLATRGLGVAVLSRSMAQAFPALLPVGVADLTTPGLLALVSRPGPAPALRALRAELRRAFGQRLSG
ncbi:LysR substrate-binding domain-containing protein [Kitasatospora sp. CB01950]|uniref:LysR substrate-binding domain-containing protein n=1 Tax=Kitasatospora sp. CB01950 TaxID=1703930 RepID=UPI00093F337B|nr:LysR substrate-binding domain-containing protein [Kitasatospora sp. CB01950]OKJ16866.1 LysR family transcriptional regulator [Kitasatospora sp. CB01950]